MAIIEDEFPLNIKPITIFESLLQQDNLTIELDNDIAITYSGKKDDDEINYKIKNILIQSENDNLLESLFTQCRLEPNIINDHLNSILKD